MLLESLTTHQHMVKRVALELGNAYAKKFERQYSKEVYGGSLHKIVQLFADANQGLANNRAYTCCINGQTTTNTTAEQCGLLGTPGPCGPIQVPPLPDLSTGKQHLRIAAHLLGDAYADKLQRTALEKPDQLEKVYKDVMQKVGQLFDDANKGFDGSLIVCRLPDGTPLPNLSKQQCEGIGGQVAP